MRAEEWREVEELLVAALELDAAGRRSLLEEAGARDPALRREVESLLDCGEATDGFLAAPALALSADFIAGVVVELDSLVGRTVGRYRILREIGRGGMGAVYLAERADGEFEQRVALKVVRRGFADPDLARRFRRERQILATLNHENVARLLDGGVSADGEPFFVMEYVEGERIDDYCDARNLSTDARLRLFLKVCDGVAYAHQRLVVHRDIKPSNILVTADGVPKLLDFGIAKLLDAEHTDEQTRTEHRAFTPEYASPEQSRGEAVTTATDVFSLGRLLRNLLQEADAQSARRERRPEGWRANGGREGHTVATNLPTRSENGAGADTSHRLLGAELRNITRVATRDEADRRYPSVAALAEDVRRYLTGLPVAAQKDSFTYRAGKFVRRNRLPVAAASLVVLSLIGGAAVAAWQARAAREKARLAAAKQVEAEESRVRAEREAEKTRKILAFMERVLSYANPAWYAEGNQLRGQARLIDVLNEMGGKIEAEFPGDLDIQAELHHKCAEIFLANQMFDRAEAHARRALELRRQVFGERHAEVAKDLYYLGAIAGQMGKTLECKNLFLRAATIFREVAPDNANLPYLLENLGSIEGEIFGDVREADKLLTESLELFRRRDGDAHHNTARLYLTLGVNAARMGETARADELFREGESRMANLPGADSHLAIAFNRGTLEFAKGNSAAAEAILKQLVIEARKLKGEESDAERNARSWLMEIYKREKEWAKLAETTRANVAAKRKTLPDTSLSLAGDLAALSVSLLRAGRTEEAKPVFEEVYRLFRRHDYGEEATHNLRINFGEALLLLGRRDEALPLIEAAYRYSVANLPPTHRDRIRIEALRAESRAGAR